jgi:hypothetical protein
MNRLPDWDRRAVRRDRLWPSESWGRVFWGKHAIWRHHRCRDRLLATRPYRWDCWISSKGSLRSSRRHLSFSSISRSIITIRRLFITAFSCILMEVAIALLRSAWVFSPNLPRFAMSAWYLSASVHRATFASTIFASRALIARTASITYR